MEEDSHQKEESRLKLWLCGLPQLGAFAAWPQGNAHVSWHNMAQFSYFGLDTGAWEKTRWQPCWCGRVDVSDAR
jgi:hypothetical protein